MSGNKALRVVLVAAGVMLVVGGVSTHALGQQMSTEFTISAHDGMESLGGVAYDQYRDEYLVVWHLTVGTFPLQSEIWARLVSADGLLGTPFIVASGFDSGDGDGRRRVQPAVAFDSFANRYLVVYLYDFYGNATDWDLRGRLIPDVGPDPSLTEFVICDLSSDQLNPAVAAGDMHQQFLVVWEDQPTNSPSFIYGTRIHAADGTSEGGRVFASGDQERSNPDLAYHWGRDEFFVNWVRGRYPGNNAVIEGLRISGIGDILEEGLLQGSPSLHLTHPAVAISRLTDNYLLAWQTEVLLANFMMVGRFISPEGGSYTPLLCQFAGYETGTFYQVRPDVSCCDRWGGPKYLLVWQKQYNDITGVKGVQGRFVRSDQFFFPSFEIMPPGSSTSRLHPKVCGGDRNYLVVWEHERDGAPQHQDIHGRFVRFTGTMAPITTNLL